jgi:signal transduction histidine kinase
VTNIGVALLAQIVIGLISLRFVRLARDEADARRHSEVLANLAVRMRTASDPEALLEAGVTTLGHALEASRVLILPGPYLAERGQRAIRQEYVDGAFPSMRGLHLPVVPPGDIPVPLGKGDAPVVIVDTAADGRVPRYLVEDYQVRSLILAPLALEDKLVGYLAVHRCQRPHRWAPAEVALVEAVANQMSSAAQVRASLRQRALVEGLIAAQEEERRAIACDLHDGLTQYVMAAHAHLETFRQFQETGDQDEADQELDNSLRYLKEAVSESRRLIQGLRSLVLDDLGLAGALEQLVGEEQTRVGWEEADLIQNVAGRHFPRALETAAYRVAQEALTNVRKHARASRVRVSLRAGRDERTGTPELTVGVRDWGRGFEPDQQRSDPAHLGLQGMVERVRLMGGSFELRSAPGAGTTIRAVFPLPEPSAGEEEEMADHE